MDKNKRIKIFVAVILVLIGIYIYHFIQRSAHILPLNKAAHQYPIASLTYSPKSELRGTIKIKMSNNEELIGIYEMSTRASTNTVYQLERSHNPTNYGELIDRTFGAKDGDQTRYTAYAKGPYTVIQCQFFLSFMWGNGVGKCHSNKGAMYRISF